MKKITTWLAIGALAAVSSAGAAFAGQPDTPGGVGKAISAIAKSDNGFNGVASSPTEGRSNNPGGLEDLRDETGANPNPANDNGGGNG